MDGPADDAPAQGGWLPPEPPGPRPDVGPPPHPPKPSAQPPPAQQWQPAGQQQWQQWQPPPAGQWQAQPGWQQPQPGWQPAASWQQYPPEPGNGPAVAGFTLALSAIGLLFISAGLAFVLALPCAVLAIVYGVKGRRRVDRGETRKHRGFAQAGFIIGIAAVVLSLLAGAVWIALFASDDFRDGLDEGLQDENGIETRAALWTAVLALRAAASVARAVTG